MKLLLKDLNNLYLLKYISLSLYFVLILYLFIGIIFTTTNLFIYKAGIKSFTLNNTIRATKKVKYS